jgi:hypothetical protein
LTAAVFRTAIRHLPCGHSPAQVLHIVNIKPNSANHHYRSGEQRRQKSANATGHILAAAHGGFYLSMAIRTFGNLHLSSIIQFQDCINKRGVTFCTGGIHAHAAFWTFVSCHLISSLV